MFAAGTRNDPAQSPSLPAYSSIWEPAWRNATSRAIGGYGGSHPGFERAIPLTPTDSPGLPLYLNDLAAALTMRYDHSGKLEDLNGATKRLRTGHDFETSL